MIRLSILVSFFLLLFEGLVCGWVGGWEGEATGGVESFAGDRQCR